MISDSVKPLNAPVVAGPALRPCSGYWFGGYPALLRS